MIVTCVKHKILFVTHFHSSERVKKSVLDVFDRENKVVTAILEKLLRALQAAGPNGIIWLLTGQTMLL